jgi:hypothetical protein
MSHTPSTPDDRRDERIQRLEEAAMQQSHDTDQLAQHVHALMQHLDRTTRRVEALEARLRALMQGADGPRSEEQQAEGAADQAG